jgi:hypothetical protein
MGNKTMQNLILKMLEEPSVLMPEILIMNRGNLSPLTAPEY